MSDNLYRFWRVTEIVNKGEAVMCASELRFVNKQGLSSTDPYRISAYSHTGDNSSSTLVDNDLATFLRATNFPDGLMSQYWIQYDFLSLVEVTHITARMMVPSWNTSWVSCRVDGSNDGVSWAPVGTCEFSFEMDSDIQITSEIKKIPVASGTKWWNCTPNTNCLFALDHDSVLGADGKSLRLANDNTDVLTGVANTVVVKNTIQGVKTQNFVRDIGTIYNYKALSFNNGALDFNANRSFPTKFTMIIYAKINKASVFLSPLEETSNNWGMAYGAGAQDPVYYNTWRFAGVPEYGAYLVGERYRLGYGHIEKLVITGDLTRGEVIMQSSYGTSRLLIQTPYFFVAGTPYRRIGYRVMNDIQLSADIIAYGLFDRNFTGVEVSQVFQKIDEQFLVGTKTGKHDTLPRERFVDRPVKQIALVGREMLDDKAYIKYFNTNLQIPAYKTERYSRDVMITEYGEINDFVYEEEIPVQTTLFLIERLTGRLVATTQSKSDGSFSFKGVDRTIDYIIISSDKKYQFNSIIKDYLKSN